MSTPDITTFRTWLFFSLGCLAALASAPVLGAEPQAGDVAHPPTAPMSSPTAPTVETDNTLLRRAQELYGRGQFAEALTAYQQLLTYRQGEYGPDRYPDGHPAIVRAFLHIGMCHRQLRDHARRLGWSQQALAMCRGLDEGELLVHCLQDVAWAQLLLQRFDVAEGLLLEAEQACERLAPSTSISTRRSLLANIRRTQGELRLSQGNERDALALLDSATNILCTDTEHKRQDSLVLREILTTATRLCTKSGRYKEAVDRHNRLIAILKADIHSQPTYGLLAALNDNLRACASLHIRLGDNATAYSCFQDALEATHHPSFGTHQDAMARRCVTLSGMAHAEISLQMFNEAVAHARDGVTLASQLFPPKSHPHGNSILASAHRHYGAALFNANDLHGARRELTHSLAMYRNIGLATRSSEQLYGTAATLSTLAALWLRIGEYDRAVECVRESYTAVVALYPSTQDTLHPEVRHAMCNLGTALAISGNLAEARQVLTLATSSNTSSKSSALQGRVLGIALTHLADVERRSGNGREAHVTISRAIDLLNEYYSSIEHSSGHSDIVNSLCCKSQLLRSEGDYDQADAVIVTAIDMARKLNSVPGVGIGTSELADVLVERSFVLSRMKRHEESKMIATEAMRLRQSLAKHIVPGFSEAEARSYVDIHLRIPKSLVASTIATGSSFDELFDLCWQRHDVLFDSAQWRIAAHPEVAEATGEFSALASKFISLSNRLGHFIRSGADGSSRSSITQLVQEVQRQRDDLESKMRVRAGIDLSSRGKRPLNLNANSLVDVLLPTEAYVEFVAYPTDVYASGRAPMRYGAFVVQSGQRIEFVELGDTAPIDEAIRLYRKKMNDPRTMDLSGLDRREFWAPVESRLNETIQKIYVCPDGGISQVPWAAIEGRTPNSYLIDRFTFIVVPSGRQALEWLVAREKYRLPTTALVVGDVNFQRLETDNAFGDAQSGGKSIDVYSYRPLPGTLAEIRSIAGILPNKQLTILSGDSATPSAVTDCLPNVALAHFATHGVSDLDFFEQSRSSQPDNSRVSELHWLIPRNPLLACGLVLANDRSTGREYPVPAGLESILSGDDISRLSLGDLDLVVLSACGTASGNSHSGEGIRGLQRAFHMAGARNVVSTLWRIDDGSTAILVKRFYASLTDGMAPAHALRQAQLGLRHGLEEARLVSAERGRISFTTIEQVDGKKATSADDKFTNPRHWGGFVLSGAGE